MNNKSHSAKQSFKNGGPGCYLKFGFIIILFQCKVGSGEEIWTLKQMKHDNKYF